ncbi:Arabinanase/levansucrase/invertase [Heliocybe sulcata]|uniref:Arabinanase/levansucrase/invertase n=1 Tax=Heliocybe sulcata TaxID=5364 RepID=A0A5C3NFW4_9AGAM|nr:Arabinanase/levansucrase/invertase [Heliocybe sulcata]
MQFLSLLLPLATAVACAFAYTNPIVDSTTPDPWMFLWNGNYYLTFTTGGDVTIYSCSSLTNCHSPASRAVFTPGANTLYNLWAPEIHDVNGNWYAFFAAQDHNDNSDNQNHHMYVLKGPASSAAPDSDYYSFVAKVSGISAWAIDGTVFTLNNQLYMVYSGWPEGDTSSLNQHLFITQLSNDASGAPTVGSAAVEIAAPQFDWETFTDSGGARHAINEGPAFLSRNGFNGVLFSGCASWASCYSIGVLQYTGSDPMSASSWTKWSDRWWQSNPDGPYGTGHCSMTTSPDGTQDWMVFHATSTSYTGNEAGTPGWNGRLARTQVIGYDSSGNPMGGWPIADGVSQGDPA